MNTKYVCYTKGYSKDIKNKLYSFLEVICSAVELRKAYKKIDDLTNIGYGERFFNEFNHSSLACFKSFLQEGTLDKDSVIKQYGLPSKIYHSFLGFIGYEVCPTIIYQYERFPSELREGFINDSCIYEPHFLRVKQEYLIPLCYGYEDRLFFHINEKVKEQITNLGFELEQYYDDDTEPYITTPFLMEHNLLMDLTQSKEITTQLYIHEIVDFDSLPTVELLAFLESVCESVEFRTKYSRLSELERIGYGSKFHSEFDYSVLSCYKPFLKEGELERDFVIGKYGFPNEVSYSFNQTAEPVMLYQYDCMTKGIREKLEETGLYLPTDVSNRICEPNFLRTKDNYSKPVLYVEQNFVMMNILAEEKKELEKMGLIFTKYDSEDKFHRQIVNEQLPLQHVKLDEYSNRVFK